MTSLTFIIPVRHQENSANWDGLVQNLKQTIRSICAQRNSDWKAIIVANQGAVLPELPKNFDVCFVDFPPNELHMRGSADLEVFREAFRLDKGRRLLAGIKHAADTKYFMFVDDDDFVHCDLTQFVSENMGENGWYINEGLIWEDNSKLLMKRTEFHLLCGTCYIVRSDLLALKKFERDIEFKYIKRTLGSHINMKGDLDKNRTPLKPLPFRGAVYRVGHADAHSKSKGIIRTFLPKTSILRAPKAFMKFVINFRWLNSKLKRTYFGAQD
jgi:glycosyltransferase involved in cell wall biosynthesis